jgi:hypothetical protein
MSNDEIMLAITVIVLVIIIGAGLCLLALMFIDEEVSPKP